MSWDGFCTIPNGCYKIMTASVYRERVVPCKRMLPKE